MTRTLCWFGFLTLLVASSAFAKEDLSTLTGFEVAYKRAIASGDFRQLEQLVYWQNATDHAREGMRFILRQEFRQQIESIQIRPYSRQALMYPPSDPNLNPTHIFTVWFIQGRDKRGEALIGTPYLIGRKDGRFYFIVSSQWPVSSWQLRKS